MSIEQRIRAIEGRLVRSDGGNRLEVLLFNTSGQFAVRIPPGVLPSMPVDVFARPHVQTGSRAVDSRLGTPAQPEKIRRPE